MSNTTLKEGQLLLRNVRLSYPHLWEAEAVKNDANARPRYGCNLLIPKADEATLARINKEITRIAKEKMKGVPPKKKDISLKDGDGDDSYDGAQGCWIMSANRVQSQGRPQVIDRDRSPLTADDGKPYAGCYVNAIVSAFVPKQWPGKVCFSLEVVQFAKDGEPFGAGRVDVDAVMPDLSDEEDDDSTVDGFGL